MSTSKRESQRKKSVPVYQCPNAESWTVPEKKLLLDVIKRHGVDDVKKLHRCIPSRSEKEISWYIEKIKLSRCHDNFSTKQNLKTPIEKWLTLIQELIFYEHEDYSQVLSSVMAVIAHGECSEDSTAASTSSHEQTEQPNYSHMYQYIEAILSGKQPPKLSKLEAAIFIDLMYALGDQLRACQSDAEMVKKLLLYKFELLNERINLDNKQENVEHIRLALDNEWPADNKYGLPVNTSEKSGSKKKRVSRKRQASSPSKNVVSTEPESEAGKETDIIQTAGQDNSTMDVNGKKGKKRSLKNSTTDNGSTKRQHISSLDAQIEKSNKQSELSPIHAASSAQVSIDEESEERQTPVGKEFKKPLLYTLNPLCIPVSLLNLNRHSKDQS